MEPAVLQTEGLSQAELDNLISQAGAGGESDRAGPGRVDRQERPGRVDSPPEVDRLLRLQVPVIVKLAERRMRLGEILKLTSSTIIEFNKSAEEPLDLLVNNVVIGRGDVVKVGENFGLRITRIGDPGETIRALGGG